MWANCAMARARRAGSIAIRSALVINPRTAWKCDIGTAMRAFTARLPPHVSVPELIINPTAQGYI